MNKIGEVIKIADYSFKLTKPKCKYFKDERCEHKKLTLDKNGFHVHCDECGVQVSTFWALERFVYIWRDAWDKIAQERQKLAKLSEKKQYLKVLCGIDRAWRGKNKMAINCPHCGRGILPEDGFGNSQCSSIFEIQKRKNNNNSKI